MINHLVVIPGEEKHVKELIELQRKELIPIMTILISKKGEEFSGLMDLLKSIKTEDTKIGIFGKVARLDDPLQPGDRVEIYRPLIADPKEIRKQRAEEGKAMRAGEGRPGDD